MWYFSGPSCHCSQFILINIERKYYLNTMNVIFFFLVLFGGRNQLLKFQWIKRLSGELVSLSSEDFAESREWSMLPFLHIHFVLHYNKLRNFLWQVFTVASNTITQRRRKKNHEAPISLFHHGSRLFDERKKVACWPVVLVVLLLMQYEHSKRHMNRRWWVRP